MARTRNFADVIRRKLAKSPDLTDAVERERFNADIAAQIFEARKAAGLTQAQLAVRIGSQQSVIARLEDADYDSHSLTMLKRIAEALGKRVSVNFHSPPIHKHKDCDFNLNSTFEADWGTSVAWTPKIETKRQVTRETSNS